MTKYYWHFVRPDKKLGHNDGRKIRRGSLLKVDDLDRLKLCSYGLHASKNVLDALSYCDWLNPILCKVKLGGKVIHGKDKSVASERKVIDYIDATKVMQQFALKVAKDVISIYEKRYPGDSRVRNCIKTTEDYLVGEATKGELKIARNAADAAAYATATVYSAAATAAAAYAARKRKNELYNKWLTEMVEAEFKKQAKSKKGKNNG